MAAVDGDAGAADPAGAWRRKERNDVPHLLGTAEPTEWELALADRRVSSAGVVTIKAQRYRSQDRNREDALERLRALICRGGSCPRPRIATRPSAASRKRRLNDKKNRARTKGLRRPPSAHE